LGDTSSLPAGDPAARSFIDDTVAAGGAKSSCLSNDDGKFLAGQWWLDVEPSTRYRLRLKIRRTAKHSIYGQLWMAAGDEKQKGLKPFGGYTGGPLNEWQEFSQEFQTPPDLYALRLYVYNRLKGAKAWFDDITVEELDPVGPR